MISLEKKNDDVRRLTSVCPKDHIVLIWSISALEKVEEQVFCLKVDVTCVCPRQWFKMDASDTRWRYSLDRTVTKVRLFNPHTVPGEERMT